MDAHLKAWRANRLLAILYAIALLALAGYVYSGGNPLPPHAQFVAFSGLSLLTVFHALAARGARLRSGWARIASLVMGVALLIVFPIGTIFGVWLLMGSWATWPDPRVHAGAPRGGWHQDGRR